MEPSEGPAAARWRDLVERRERQMDAAYAAVGRTSADYWTRRIGNRPSMLQRMASDDDPTLRAMLPFLSPDSNVLDVGAGAGRYTLALAPKVRSIVAVEPDAAMIPRLEAGLAECGASNVTIVRSRWQETGVAPAEVVLCAHVLYPIADAVPFVRKLDAFALRACFVVLRETAPEPEPLGRLWSRFHGEPRFLQPGYLEAFNLLYEEGIRANVSVIRVSGPTWTYETLDAAIAGVREHLILAESRAIDDELREELEATLVRDGALLSLPAEETYAGVLWWEKQA